MNQYAQIINSWTCRYYQMHSCHHVNIKLKFRSHSFTLSIYSFSQNFEVNCPLTRQRSFITLLANPVAPSLKFMTAELIPNSRVFPPMKTSFGSLFYTTPFKHSLLFWVLPRRHFFNSSGLLRSLKIGITSSLTTVGILGLSM